MLAEILAAFLIPSRISLTVTKNTALQKVVPLAGRDDLTFLPSPAAGEVGLRERSGDAGSQGIFLPLTVRFFILIMGMISGCDDPMR